MSTLYRKYRPQTWADVSGQNHVKVTLAFEIATGKIAHAYLFSGPRGVGKTTAARIFSRAVNCLERAKRTPTDGEAGEPCGTCESCTAILEGRSLDVIEIDAASHRGIDAVRENIIENARFSPSRLAYKVFIIDEVHMLTTEAFNALLKTLEEPPSHVVFILATTESHKVPQTILSRCQRFEFRKIPYADLVDRLHRLAEREKVKVDRRTLEEIARHADGSLRDAESLLGKVLTMGDGKRVTYDEALVALPRSDRQALALFVDALLHHDARSALMTIGDCMEGGIDIDQFATDAVELLRRTLLAKMSGSVDVFSAEMDETSKKQLEGWLAISDVAELVFALETLMAKRREIKSSHPSQLPLELAAVRICEQLRVGSEQEGSATAGSSLAPASPDDYGKKRQVDAARPHSRQEATVATRADAAAAATAVLERVVEAPELVPIIDESAEAARITANAPVTSIERIREVWKEFVAKAGERNAGLPYILGVATPIEVAGKIIRIGFDFAFHKDKMNQEKNRRMLEDALGGLLGSDVRVEGVLLEKKAVSEDGAWADGEISAPAAATAVGGNILQAFGGRVVE